MREPAWLPGLAALVVVGLFAFGLQMNGGPPTRATFTLRDLSPPPTREVAATIRLNPSDAAEHAEWVNVTGWQGGGSVVDPLHKVAPGIYRTTKPIPAYDNWKVTMRLHKGATVASVPIYMPADPAIPVQGIPARRHFTRTFVRDKKNLQREQKGDVPGFLTTLAYLIVLAIGLGLAGSLAWGLARLDRTAATREPQLRREKAEQLVP